MLTPEQRDKLRAAAERMIATRSASNNDYLVARDAYEDIATPTAILAILAQLEEAERKNCAAALQYLSDEGQARGDWDSGRLVRGEG